MQRRRLDVDAFQRLKTRLHLDNKGKIREGRRDIKSRGGDRRFER